MPLTPINIITTAIMTGALVWVMADLLARFP